MRDKPPAHPRDVAAVAITAGMETAEMAGGIEAMNDILATSLACHLLIKYPEDTRDDAGHRLLQFARMALDRWELERKKRG